MHLRLYIRLLSSDFPVVLRPSPCLNSNWWLSFDKEGWSKCKNENVFITGFWRNALSGWNDDGIYKLEAAKCCPSSSLYTGKASDCKRAYWWSSLDKYVQELGH